MGNSISLAVSEILKDKQKLYSLAAVILESALYLKGVGKVET